MQPLADLRSLNTNYGVIAGVVVNRAAKHLGTEHSFTQAIQFSSKCVLDNQLKEVLGALTTHERFAGKHLLEVASHSGSLLERKLNRAWILQNFRLPHDRAEVYHAVISPV